MKKKKIFNKYCFHCRYVRYLEERVCYLEREIDENIMEKYKRPAIST
jgi:hypothetical protein